MEHLAKDQDRAPRTVYLLPLGAGLAALLGALPLMHSVRAAEYDEAIFLDVARNIQRVGLPLRSLGTQGIFFFDHTSLYVYLLSLYARASDAGVFVARLVTLFAALGCVGLTFLIGRELSMPAPGRAPGRLAPRTAAAWSGLLAALLLAVNPFFVTYAFFIRMEVFMLGAMLMGLYLLMRGQHSGRERTLLAAGAALAIAALFKEFALLLTACSVVYVLWTTPGWHVKLRRALLLAAPTLLAMAVWAFFCWRLSPGAFEAVMQRWFDAAVTGVADSRALTTAWSWLREITLDLVGPLPMIGLLALVVWQAGVRRRWPTPERLLLWAYGAAAIGVSFGIRLKEVRHLIGVIPVVALLIGSGINWEAALAHTRRWAAVGRGLALSALTLGLVACSPAVVWMTPYAQESGIAASYRQRLYENDVFYQPLALVGDYLHGHTAPGVPITVVHQAPTVAYYADRPYEMLYTYRAGDVGRVLDGTQWLVWDDTLFTNLNAKQLRAVNSYIAGHFTVAQVVPRGSQQITIYRRIDGG
jgi:4-amino-4-deoxy-L-arabinose transferase-like glycosyltransferase